MFSLQLQFAVADCTPIESMVLFPFFFIAAAAAGSQPV